MINHPYFDELRAKIRLKNNEIASKRKQWINNNLYFYKQLLKALQFIIPENAKVLHIGCSTGYILNQLKPSVGVGVDDTEAQIAIAKADYPHLIFINQTPELSINSAEIFDFVLISSIEDIVDIKAVLEAIKPNISCNTRIIITHYNYLWNPIVKAAEKLKLKIPQKLHNWITFNDLRNFLTISGYEDIINRSFILLPYNIPILSYILNRFVAKLPIFRLLTMMRLTVARLIPEQSSQDYSVSVIIPCRNEAGNIEEAVKRIPALGSHVEIIFGDDKSTDGTPEKIKEMIAQYPEKDIKLVNSPGICKAYNVWTCFDVAKGDILMILDADLTVLPEELPYFYEAIAKRRGEFINGSRLVYPMHNNAMPFFNTIGNKFFSLAFTYILDTPIKDTLCGTKVLWRNDYEKIKKLRGSWGIDDRWGDYELIFGAAKQHLKIIDLPVHYYERVYGETKMKNRIKNGLIMLKMCKTALMKIKFNH
jgi:hypothetical protein